MDQEKIRPLYSELQGYLSQAPMPERVDDVTNNADLWTFYNDSVNMLNDVTGENFSRFLVTPEEEMGDDYFGEYVRISTYRQKLSGLISYLHGKYFFDDPAPFSGGPDTFISQNVQQTQSTHVQILLDVQSTIDKNMSKYTEGSREKGFLQKLKDSLGSISNVNQLINTLLQLAKDFGLKTEDLFELFS